MRHFKILFDSKCLLASCDNLIVTSIAIFPYENTWLRREIRNRIEIKGRIETVIFFVELDTAVFLIYSGMNLFKIRNCYTTVCCQVF